MRTRDGQAAYEQDVRARGSGRVFLRRDRVTAGGDETTADISARGPFHVRNNRRIDRLWTRASQKVS